MKCTHTLPYRGSELFITFDYTPTEAASREHPGCPEDIEIEKVELEPKIPAPLELWRTTKTSHVRWCEDFRIDVTDLLEPQFPELVTALLELKEDR